MSAAEESVFGDGEFRVGEIAAAVHGGQLSQLSRDIQRQLLRSGCRSRHPRLVGLRSRCLAGEFDVLWPLRIDHHRHPRSGRWDLAEHELPLDCGFVGRRAVRPLDAQSQRAANVGVVDPVLNSGRLTSMTTALARTPSRISRSNAYTDHVSHVAYPTTIAAQTTSAHHDAGADQSAANGMIEARNQPSIG